MSRKINLGKVSITPKGRWTAEAAYERLDAVLHDGTMWIAKSANSNCTPEEGSQYWEIAVEGSVSSGAPVAAAKPLAFLPSVIYVAEGCTVEIYNKQVCSDAEKYNFKWSSSVGKAYERKFSITGTSSLTGRSFSLSLDITDSDGVSVWSGTSTIYVVEMIFFNKKLICPVGDMHSDGKIWLDEVCITLSDDMIGFVGTLENDSGMLHEGRTGWTSSVYLSKAENKNAATGSMMENPFYDGGFSWSYYTDSCDDYPDAVQLFFGERELYSESVEDFVNNIKAMVDMIKEDAGDDMPVFIVLPPCCGSQDGIAELGQLDKAVFNGKSKYEADRIFIEASSALEETFGGDSYTDVYLVPLTQCFDSENNYPTKQINENPRSSITKTIHADSLHPTESGYKQMADLFFSFYCGVLSE